jgi:hypothetical protein
MSPLRSDKIFDVERPTAGHAGSEACGEVVRPGGVCGCGTNRVRLPTVGVLRGKNQAFSPGQQTKLVRWVFLVMLGNVALSLAVTTALDALKTL